MNDRPFRRSIYLTLVMCCACLGFSEWDYLPEVTLFTAAVAAIMLVAWRMDERDTHFTLRQANLVGVVIFVVAAVWIGFSYGNPDSLMHTLPWPAGGLPYLAPLLMLLIPAKLLRPKHDLDWWGLYCISLACVGLAMSMAENVAFMLLVFAYAAIAVWSLTLFFYHRSRTPSPGTRTQLGRSVRWLAVASLVAVPVFFLTPRTAGVTWELFNSKMESGLNADGTPDLSRTGQLKLSNKVAFEVQATDPATGAMRSSLSTEQRWRGPGYAEYQTPRGRWVRTVGRTIMAPDPTFPARNTPDLMVPNLGPGSTMLDFRIVATSNGPAFFDPVAYKPGQHSTIAVPTRHGYGYAQPFWDASFVLLQREFRVTNRYLQVVPANPQPAAFQLAEGNEDELLAPFTTPPPQGVVYFTQTVLAGLFQNGQLNRDIAARLNREGHITPQDAATIARAFTLYLAQNGGFSYTLDLRRQDKTLDPIEDFLLNTRTGHCERFATALVLMLRAVGIPAQFVLGYVGCEMVEPGKFVVRQSTAHAWAEVLLSRQNANGQREWYWQTYDPTPSRGGEDDTNDSSAIESGTRQTQRLFSEYVINLNPDTQKRLTEDAVDFFEQQWPVFVLAIGGIEALFLAVRRIRQPRSKPAPRPWFESLPVALQLPMLLGETPREYAERAKTMFPQHAGLIERATEIHEANRYRGENEDDRAIRAEIEQLKRV